MGIYNIKNQMKFVALALLGVVSAVKDTVCPGGVCPLDNAVCCSDGLGCCPNGTTCCGTQQCCSSTSNPFMVEALLPVAEVEPVKDTVCPGGICPLDNAVCCSDGLGCCPQNTTCCGTQQCCNSDKTPFVMTTFKTTLIQ